MAGVEAILGFLSLQEDRKLSSGSQAFGGPFPALSCTFENLPTYPQFQLCCISLWSTIGAEPPPHLVMEFTEPVRDVFPSSA